MNSESSTSPSTGESWDAYWQGISDAQAWSAGGVRHPAVTSFWQEWLTDAKQRKAGPRLIDIAGGSGAVVDAVQAVFADGACDITCADISEHAIQSLERRFEGITGIVADAASMPLGDGAFDLVTSQFGVEYAGESAFGEAARLVAPGGSLALIVHHRGGGIFLESAASLDALRRLQRSNFIPLAIDLFETGFAACRGADRGPYDAAGTALSPAVRELESIMETHGEHIAGDTVSRLYSDVGRIHAQIQHYEPAEVLGWLRTMEREIEPFAVRMSSMCEAALDADAFDRVVAAIAARDFTVTRAGPLPATGQNLPLAWVLAARRNGGN